MRRVPVARSLAVLTLTGLLAGCTAGGPDSVAPLPPTLPPAASSSADPVAVSAIASRETIVTNLKIPWGIAFLPDGSALVTERATHRVVQIGTDLKAREVAVIEEAGGGGEGGLLGIAVSPQYATDKLIFLYYTTADDNRIASWKIGERPSPIVTGIPSGGIHNGGRLGFGPDGFLYAGTGESGDPPLGQSLRTLGGKILRMTKTGRPAPGNPFPDSLIWSYGHRNVQGFAWDSGGHMWASEFGQNTWDEINRIEPGKNYGWPTVEGAAQDSRFVDPVVAWHPPEASCSGITIVGDLLVDACLRGQKLWLVPIDAMAGTVKGEPVAALQDAGRLRAAVAAPDGSIWVANNGTDGKGPEKTDDDRIVRVKMG
jgi:glucose/arabinose dehydrogenase